MIGRSATCRVHSPKENDCQFWEFCSTIQELCASYPIPPKPPWLMASKIPGIDVRSATSLSSRNLLLVANSYRWCLRHVQGSFWEHSNSRMPRFGCRFGWSCTPLVPCSRRSWTSEASRFFLWKMSKSDSCWLFNVETESVYIYNDFIAVVFSFLSSFLLRSFGKTSFHTEPPDPISGASSVGSPGYAVVALWTEECGESRGHLPSAAKGFPEKFLAEVDGVRRFHQIFDPQIFQSMRICIKPIPLVIFSCCLPMTWCMHVSDFLCTWLTLPQPDDPIQYWWDTWKVQLCPNRNACTEVESLPRIAMNGSFILTATSQCLKTMENLCIVTLVQ